MVSDPDRHRVVPKSGDESKNGRARCPRQPSPSTCAPRRSPSSSRCPQRRSAVGRRRVCCPTSAPWAATDATPTPRSGPCWKACPSHPRPASRAPRLTAPAPLCPWLRWSFGIVLRWIGIVSDPGHGRFPPCESESTAGSGLASSSTLWVPKTSFVGLTWASPRQRTSAMIASHGIATALPRLLPAHHLARTAYPQPGVQERRDPPTTT
jgi:hypothetical protein